MAGLALKALNGIFAINSIAADEISKMASMISKTFSIDAHPTG